jgi:alcohol dehydrogenase class IV
MFRFRQETEVLFGKNELAELSGELKRRSIDKLLLVFDPGIEKAGILAKVADTLHEAGADCHVFNEIEPNPTDTTMTRGAEVCSATGCDAVLGVGGGSPIDSAKVIAMLATNAEPLEHYLGKGADAWENAPLPILAIPTAAGTGAEVSAASMINLTAERRKVDIFGSTITPTMAAVERRRPPAPLER